MDRDARIRLVETADDRYYEVEGKRLGGVTAWIDTLFPPFDAPAVAAKLAARPCGRTAEDFLRDWETRRDEGTALHAAIEAFYAGNEDAALQDVCWTQFKRWQADHGWTCLRTEWMVWETEKWKMCGTVDAVFRRPDGSIAIVDWKRCAGFRYDNPWESGVHRLTKRLPNANFVRYSLQLAVYALLLERNYDLQVAACYLVRFHPSSLSYEMLAIPEEPRQLARMILDETFQCSETTRV